jgi:hypothetical protein
VVGFGISGPEVIVLVVAILLAVFVVGIFLYLSRRLRARRDQLVGELRGRPELIQDRAFNRLAMARREAEILGRGRADISSSQTMIAQAQAAFDLHQYPRAYELAQQAHESLVNARTAPDRPSAPLAGTGDRPTPGGLAPPTSAGASAASSAGPLPKNRAESHFLLGLLTNEIAAAPPRAGPTLEAISLRDQAQAAFDRGSYAESFRLALRGRRALGGRIEALAATPSAPSGARLAPGSDPDGVADAVAGSTRCPACGYPTLSDDTFCRGCGRPLTASTCPSCGAPRTKSDVFCGRCGVSFSP